jgi:hypothetical protein
MCRNRGVMNEDQNQMFEKKKIADVFITCYQRDIGRHEFNLTLLILRELTAGPEAMVSETRNICLRQFINGGNLSPKYITKYIRVSTKI